MELNTIRLLVGDFPAELGFWRDVMGLAVGYSDEAMGYAYLTAGSTTLELFSRDGFAAALGEATPVPAPVGRQAVLVFKVDDVDAAYADLVGRGATPVLGPQSRLRWGARTAHLSDPEGNLVELYSPLRDPDAPTA